MKKLVILMLAVLLLFAGCVNTEEAPGLSANGEFEVHFIDVGQADCSLIICDDEAMLIDGGNTSDSSLVYSYLKKYSVDILKYVVLSHAHEDHVGGIPGAMRYADVEQVLAPVAASDADCYEDFVAAVKEQGLEITNPLPGEEFSLGGGSFEILGPIEEDPDELNNTSLVLKMTYDNVSVLFTGDAETLEERSIIKAGYDVSATVLKAAHHGSETSSSYSFLREVMPRYVVISVGQNNSYGHPHESVLSKYAALDATVYRTDINGTVILRSDGADISFETEKKSSQKPADDGYNADGGAYIGNKNSKKYHLPSCGALPKEKNKIFFDTEEEARKEGYTPCGNCF